MVTPLTNEETTAQRLQFPPSCSYAAMQLINSSDRWRSSASDVTFHPTELFPALQEKPMEMEDTTKPRERTVE